MDRQALFSASSALSAFSASSASVSASVSRQMVEAACQWAIMHGVAIKNSNNTARHCPFTVAPVTIRRAVYQQLLQVTPVLARLISRVSEDHGFLQQTLAPVAGADPFFGQLLQWHQQLHGQGEDQAVRQPLLLMRTDFMNDCRQGPRIVEFNTMAAGMGPFGQRACELHRFIQEQWPQSHHLWGESPKAEPAENNGLQQLAGAIAEAARRIRADFDENVKAGFKAGLQDSLKANFKEGLKEGQKEGLKDSLKDSLKESLKDSLKESLKQERAPTFLMVVQPDEDNVYDQHLLELALQARGVRTFRRTFAELSTALSTGTGQRLLLDGVEAVDLVYLRAGYQYSDYDCLTAGGSAAQGSLHSVRLFIEQHHVAVNATVSQQLAGSKAMQAILTELPPAAYARWGLDPEEAEQVKRVLTPMHRLSRACLAWFAALPNPEDWVLKNQGEGGGHCVFGKAIAARLGQLTADQHAAWALMGRLYPQKRQRPVLAVRHGQATEIADLVSEIGLFSAFFNDEPMTPCDGYAGYLVRSKPARENEGGIHSGQGLLDSLALVD